MASQCHILRLAAFGLGIGCLVLTTSCARFSKQIREPASQSGCLGSVFLIQGQLAQFQFGKLTTLQHPYGNIVIREAVLSPDLQQVAVLAETGTPSTAVPEVLFYECNTTQWHLGFQDKTGGRFSKLTWSPDGNWVAFLKQGVQNFRDKGRDWHRMVESIGAVSWPSFEVRSHLTLKSFNRQGVGVIADITRQNLSVIHSFQFHPAKSLMVIETVPEHHRQVHIFRVVDLAKAHPEFPVDFTPWFEVPARYKTKLFLTDTVGIRLEQGEGQWEYSMAAVGVNDFKTMKVTELLKGKGVQPLFLRDNVLYLKVQTTTRTHIYGVSITPEVSPSSRQLAAAQTVDSIFVYEGQESIVNDFDIFLNRLVYSCRSKTSDLNRVCLGRASDVPVHTAPVFVADEKNSVYPVLTYWPR